MPRPRRVAKRKTVRSLVKSEIKRSSELKFFDKNGTSATVSASHVIVDLFTPSQGDTRLNRDGDVVQLDKLHMNMNILPQDAADPLTIRLLVFQWKPDSASNAPVWNEVITTNDDYLAHRNIPHMSQYKILMDKIVSLDSSALGNDRTTSIRKSFAIPLKKCTFNLGATSGRNKLYFGYVGDATLTAQANIDYKFRVTYRDG